MDKAWLFFFKSLPKGMLLILQREEGRERERERNIDLLPLVYTPTRDWTHSLGMCPDQESNPWPSGLWDNTPTNWITLTRARLALFFFLNVFLIFSPGWCSSVDWAPACESKGHWFNSQSGHMPGLWAKTPVGGVLEATTHWCFSSTLSLFPSV